MVLRLPPPPALCAPLALLVALFPALLLRAAGHTVEAAPQVTGQVPGAAAGQVSPQPRETVPPPLADMVDTERMFAQRALVVGWKQAFLEYFSESAVGYEDGVVGSAKEQVRNNPDPPPDHQLLWDPRYGDVAGSGELGYLTGPSRNILPSRNNGQPRHGAYASVWKRERDGRYRVVIDIGVPTPRAPAFAQTFTRAPSANRFTGDYDERTPPLGAADGVLNSDLKISVARAYRGRLTPGVRFHRPGSMPVAGEAAALKWLASQARFAQLDSRFSESAQSGDLGYTWGTWTRPAAAASRGAAPARGRASGGRSAPPPQETGFYLRVWVREKSGQWKVALDVLY
jgi:hypothetical protein